VLRPILLLAALLFLGSPLSANKRLVDGHPRRYQNGVSDSREWRGAPAARVGNACLQKAIRHE
jgi:hypothetical protein